MDLSDQVVVDGDRYGIREQRRLQAGAEAAHARLEQVGLEDAVEILSQSAAERFVSREVPLEDGFPVLAHASGAVLLERDGRESDRLPRGQRALGARELGVGEQLDDLRDFNAAEFVSALLDTEQNTD